MSTPYNIVFVTAPDRKTAEDLAEGMVKSKLAACVNAVPGVSSVYWWKGRLEKAEEVMLVIKTRGALLPELCEYVRKNHPNAIPEVLSLPIEQGHEPYLDWVGAHTRFVQPHARRRERA